MTALPLKPTDNALIESFNGRLCQECLNQHWFLSLEDALPKLRERLASILATDDAREGLTAFLEKRKPVWTGKLRSPR